MIFLPWQLCKTFHGLMSRYALFQKTLLECPINQANKVEETLSITLKHLNQYIRVWLLGDHCLPEWREQFGNKRFHKRILTFQDYRGFMPLATCRHRHYKLHLITFSSFSLHLTPLDHNKVQRLNIIQKWKKQLCMITRLVDYLTHIRFQSKVADHYTTRIPFQHQWPHN